MCSLSAPIVSDTHVPFGRVLYFSASLPGHSEIEGYTRDVQENRIQCGNELASVLCQSLAFSAAKMALSAAGGPSLAFAVPSLSGVVLGGGGGADSQAR